MYRGPRPSFHIRGLDVPLFYKLYLSHLGEKNTNFFLRILWFCSSGLSANIDEMGIPFQIIRNRHTEVFDTFNIFQYCTLNGVGSLNLI